LEGSAAYQYGNKRASIGGTGERCGEEEKRRWRKGKRTAYDNSKDTLTVNRAFFKRGRKAFSKVKGKGKNSADHW